MLVGIRNPARLLFLCYSVTAAMVNVTIDDTVGDPMGLKIRYDAGSWKQGGPGLCSGCFVHLEGEELSSVYKVCLVLPCFFCARAMFTSLFFQKTWHDTTANANSVSVASVQFVGESASRCASPPISSLLLPPRSI